GGGGAGRPGGRTGEGRLRLQSLRSDPGTGPRAARRHGGDGRGRAPGQERRSPSTDPGVRSGRRGAPPAAAVVDGGRRGGGGSAGGGVPGGAAAGRGVRSAGPGSRRRG